MLLAAERVNKVTTMAKQAVLAVLEAAVLTTVVLVVLVLLDKEIAVDKLGVLTSQEQAVAQVDKELVEMALKLVVQGIHG